MADLFGSSIYWLETSHRLPAPSLEGSVEVDVAIVGGGYTGLWTAYHLSEADPSLRVAVIEAESIGSGASGRNGGFAMTLLDLSLTHLRRNHGDESAAAAHRAVSASVAEIGATVETEGIDCEWRHGGLMVVATNPAQRQRLEGDRRVADDLGLEGFTWLDSGAARAELDSPTYLAGLREDGCAVLHPAKLAHGLARVLEARGTRLYEYTPVLEIDDVVGGVRISTPSGRVTASQVVLATNAWAGSQRWIPREVVALYTYIGLTEPLTDAQWDSIGWSSHCGVEDRRNFVHYYRRTLDGRILWGGKDGIVYRKGRISPRFDRHQATFARLQRSFAATFPQLRSVRFTHHWGGPVGITANFVPIFGTLREGRLHYGVGYNGHGVAPSHTGGKILAAKVTGRADELCDLCFVDRRAERFPPDPFLWVGAEASRRALLRQDSLQDRGRGFGDMDPVLVRLMRKLP